MNSISLGKFRLNSQALGQFFGFELCKPFFNSVTFSKSIDVNGFDFIELKDFCQADVQDCRLWAGLCFGQLMFGDKSGKSFMAMMVVVFSAVISAVSNYPLVSFLTDISIVFY